MNAACPACVLTPAAIELTKPKAMSSVLSIPSIKCAACIHKVETALNDLPDVIEARVNLTLKRVVVEGGVEPETLVNVLRENGFDAYPFDVHTSQIEQDKISKDLILRLGVAGFAMMNVMLLSVAVWSGATDATRDLFHLISAAIALPTTLFAAQPFFKTAISALSVGRLNMDVPISLAILLAAGMSFYETLNGGAHAYFDAALSLTFFLLLGRVLEHRTRAAARSAAAELSALETRTAQILCNDHYESIPISQLNVGDTILVATGMRAPADGKVLEDTVLTDRSFLTGESNPVSSGKNDRISAGEINIGAPFHITVSAVGDDTNLRQIAKLVETAENARNSYTSIADRAAQVYAPLVHILAFVAFAGWFFATGDLRYALNIAIAVLIITCPCALGLAVPAVTTTAIGQLYRLGFLVKSGTALERLAVVDTVYLDKTGTLTRPNFNFDLNALPLEAQKIAKALVQSSQHPYSRALNDVLHDITPAKVMAIHEKPGKYVTGEFQGETVAFGRADLLGGENAEPALLAYGRLFALQTEETLRSGANILVSDLAAGGLTIKILSGDTAEKTKALARRIGVLDWAATLSPQAKASCIAQAQRNGQRIAMLGDGINDTIALGSAYASLAPSTALDAARTVADVVILKESFSDVPKLFSMSKAVVQLSRQNFAIAAIYNLIAVPIALFGFATPLLAALAMSISSLTVLLNAFRIKLIK